MNKLTHHTTGIVGPQVQFLPERLKLHFSQLLPKISTFLGLKFVVFRYRRDIKNVVLDTKL
jgi:hypothetical protein